MRRMRIVLPILILGLIFVVGSLLTPPSQAQNGPTWLPFDGSSRPAEPSLSLSNATSTVIELQATLPGAYAETINAEGTAYTQRSGPGYGITGEYGLPDRPVLRREVEIPFGAQVSIDVISPSRRRTG